MTRVHICSQVNGEAGGFERWSCDGENVEGSSMSMFFDVDGAFGCMVLAMVELSLSRHVERCM